MAFWFRNIVTAYGPLMLWQPKILLSNFNLVERPRTAVWNLAQDTCWIWTHGRTCYTLFLIWNLVFPGQAEYSYFSAYFSLKIFLYYSWIIIEKERIYHIFLRFVHIFFTVYYRYVFQSCTVHRTVISTEHLAITNAGFFVLLWEEPMTWYG